MKTYQTKQKEIKQNWHLFNAEGKVLGRLASQIAQILMGKEKSYFVPHLDCGDFVVVLNVEKVKVTGNKEKGKIYYHHTGFPDGLRAASLEKVRSEHPERIIQHAVLGMLPKNKLRDQRMKRLLLFSQETHPYKDKEFIVHN